MKRMAKKSAGLLMFRRPGATTLEVLLVHPGGPFWARKDLAAWSLPKGEYEARDDPLEAAQREFTEETGFRAVGPFLALGALKQPSGKTITAWAFEGDCDPQALTSNTFELEWPPHSGQTRAFPEVDRAAWFDTAEARRRILPAQSPFLAALERLLG
jgi:predicted NUDIX family NTP pyrophosphohydrolase